MLQDRKLDKTTPIPLYFQLKKLLLEEIKNNEYPVDSMIPTEKEISEYFQISRTTVRQAISELVQAGWLYRIKSKGTFVARAKVDQSFIMRLEPFDQQMKRLHRTPSTELIDFKIISMPDEVAAVLSPTHSGNAIFMHRKRCVDGDPIVTVKTYLALERCAFLMDHDMTRESMYNVLAQNPDTRICCADRVLEATIANCEDMELMHMTRGKPVQLFKTIGYNRAGDAIEYSIARYRGDQNRFSIHLLIDDDEEI